MKTIAIVHDVNYTDVDKMMSNIDYVASTSKVFEGEFLIHLEEKSSLEPIISGSGLPYVIGKLPEEPDVVISFVLDDPSTEVHQLMIKQWQSRRPVYPFMVVKK